MPSRPLNAKDLKEFKKVLLTARAAITGDIEQLEEEALTAGGTLAGEVREEVGDPLQDFNLELLQHDEDTLKAIDEALERLAKKEFGLCTACGERIGLLRLRAMPHAAKCIDCQRAAEREAS